MLGLPDTALNELARFILSAFKDL